MSKDSESSHEQLASNQKQQTDLEVKDDGPDQTKGQLRVAVGDVIVPDVHQFDLRQRNHWDLGSWLVCIERQRQRERVTERQRERDRQTDSCTCLCLRKSKAIWTFCSL